jgi:hypothetical protein
MMGLTATAVTLATVPRRRKKAKIGRTPTPLHTMQVFYLMADTYQMQRRKLQIKRRRTKRVIKRLMVMSPTRQQRHNPNHQRSLVHM